MKVYIGEVDNGKMIGEVGYYSHNKSTIPKALDKAIRAAIRQGKLEYRDGGTRGGVQVSYTSTVYPKDLEKFITIFIMDIYNWQNGNDIYIVTRTEA